MEWLAHSCYQWLANIVWWYFITALLIYILRSRQKRIRYQIYWRNVMAGNSCIHLRCAIVVVLVEGQPGESIFLVVSLPGVWFHNCICYFERTGKYQYIHR